MVLVAVCKTAIEIPAHHALHRYHSQLFHNHLVFFLHAQHVVWRAKGVEPELAKPAQHLSLSRYWSRHLDVKRRYPVGEMEEDAVAIVKLVNVLDLALADEPQRRTVECYGISAYLLICC